MEETLCLSFLEHEFAAKHEDEKVVDIVQKIWRTMSEMGSLAGAPVATLRTCTSTRWANSERRLIP